MSNMCQRMFGYLGTGVRDNSWMENQLKVQNRGVDGVLRDVGPLDAFRDFPLQIPERFTRLVTTEGSERAIELTLHFDGQKLRIMELRIRDEVNPITPRELLSLSLPKLVRACAESAIPNSEFWTRELPRLPNIENQLRDDLLLLSKLYWFEYITWGNPRVEVQRLLQCQKTTANYYIRLASKFHTLPEARLSENKKATAQDIER